MQIADQLNLGELGLANLSKECGIVSNELRIPPGRCADLGMAVALSAEAGAERIIELLRGPCGIGLPEGIELRDELPPQALLVGALDRIVD
jgi:hypothetical protein